MADNPTRDPSIGVLVIQAPGSGSQLLEHAPSPRSQMDIDPQSRLSSHDLDRGNLLWTVQSQGFAGPESTSSLHDGHGVLLARDGLGPRSLAVSSAANGNL